MALRLCGLLMMVGSVQAFGQAVVDTSSPIGFFTNIAARLLKNECGLEWGKIQVYPTNQYTASVHRLLQVSANLYDATTNRSFGVEGAGFPAVFRPLYLTTYTNGLQVFITGYEEVTNADLVVNPPPLRDLSSTNDLPVLPRDMVYNVPLIIGARKGFPNFNQFEMLSGVQVTRKLEFIRYDLNAANRYPDETNQMFIVGISNLCGVEVWNPYSTDYPRNLALLCSGQLTVYLTNEIGEALKLTNNSQVQRFTFSNFWSSVGPWPGFRPFSFSSFKLPLFTNWWPVPNSVFWQGNGPTDEQFIPLDGPGLVFEKHPDAVFRVPTWGLETQVRLLAAMVDTDVIPNRIVDYVCLASQEPAIDITRTLTLNNDYSPVYWSGDPYIPDGRAGAMWATNRYNPSGGQVTESTPTYGIVNQIGACMGSYTWNTDWGQTSGAPPEGFAREGAINFFRTNFARLHAVPGTYSPNLYITNRFYALFMPTRSVFFYTSWQANDPLVHQRLESLRNSLLPRIVSFDANYSDRTIANLLRLNIRYEPWGGGYGNPNHRSSETLYDLRFKDSGVGGSGDWTFPTNLASQMSSLGRVHRGTPWQTLYLKSDNGLTFSQWWNWLYGDSLPTDWATMLDARLTMPSHDWPLAAQVMSLLNANQPTELASPNMHDVASWQQVLDGIVIKTNTWPDTDLMQLPPPRFDELVMTADSPQAEFLSEEIVEMLSAPGRGLIQPGEILSVPGLSVYSPWLHVTSDQIKYGLTDEAYEAIPSQLLPRLRMEGFGTITTSDSGVQVRFAGWGDYRFAVETSSDLRTWTSVGTNEPPQESVLLPRPAEPAATWFYRAALLK